MQWVKSMLPCWMMKRDQMCLRGSSRWNLSMEGLVHRATRLQSIRSAASWTRPRRVHRRWRVPSRNLRDKFNSLVQRWCWQATGP